MSRTTLIAILAALAAAPACAASVTVGTNAAASGLRVDAAGNAEISWHSAGRRSTAIVPASGRIVLGESLVGPDVGRTVAGSHIPFQRALRFGPGGWYYALQAWRVAPGGPVELRFSRWRGVPTELSLTAKQTALGVRLTGRATFDEKPLPPTKTAAGLVQRRYVTLEAKTAAGWTRLGRALLSSKAAYAFTALGTQEARSYRATVSGPNVGATIAPDAAAVVPAPVELDPGR